MFSHFQIKDRDLLHEKIARFTQKNTRIVTDFDSTITQENGINSWGLIFTQKLIPQTQLQQHYLFKERYYPYEVDAALSSIVRNGYMREWWQKSLDLLAEAKLKKEDLQQSAVDGMYIRDGFDHLFYQTNSLSMPMLILSAGITQSIEAVLRAKQLSFPNISIASNRLIFDDQGICINAGRDIIHVANKDEWDIESSIQETFTDRNNILLF